MTDTTTLTLPDWAAPAPYTNPDLVTRAKIFDTYYGVDTCDVGEDGDMLILGHVGVLRAIGVFHARLRILTDTVTAQRAMESIAVAQDCIVHGWAVVKQVCDEYPTCLAGGRDCPVCAKITPYDFRFFWVTPDEPDAFPVTRWVI